jgi:hypothetical protein
MSPAKSRGAKVAVSSNLYTALLALGVGIVLATAAFVAYMCYFQYGTIWKIP